jgi:type III secretory pathway component EscT
MTTAAIASAAFRALPLCLILPFPTTWARLALGIVLAVVGASAMTDVEHLSIARELARGLALGLGVAVPVYAARAAGAAFGAVAVRRDPGIARLATTLAWSVFLFAGGGSFLVGTYLRSYLAWPVGEATATNLDALVRTGGQWLALVAQLALPILSLVALVEIVAALVSRFEDTARLDGSGSSSPIVSPIATMVRAARPILVLVLFAASIAAFTHGVGGRVIAATH